MDSPLRHLGLHRLLLHLLPVLRGNHLVKREAAAPFLLVKLWKGPECEGLSQELQPDQGLIMGYLFIFCVVA